MSTAHIARMAIVVCLPMLEASIEAQGRATKQDILAGVEASHGGIRSLQVRYSRPARGPRGHHVVAELAFVGGQHMVIDGGHGWKGVPWQKYYGRSRSYAIGEWFEVDWPNKLAWERIKIKNDVRIQRFEVQSWLRASGYWPDNACLPEPESFGVPVGLRTALRDERYVVLEKMESVSGAKCVALARGEVDRLWLDPERGYALRARRISLKGRTAMDIQVHALERFGAGPYLPTAYSVAVYSDVNGDPLERAVEFRATVLETKINVLSAEELKLEHRPGALRFDRWDPRNFEQTEPGGLEFLLAEARKERQWVMRRDRKAGSWNAIWILVLAILTGAWGLPVLWSARGSAAANVANAATGLPSDDEGAVR